MNQSINSPPADALKPASATMSFRSAEEFLAHTTSTAMDKTMDTFLQTLKIDTLQYFQSNLLQLYSLQQDNMHKRENELNTIIENLQGRIATLNDQLDSLQTAHDSLQNRYESQRVKQADEKYQNHYKYKSQFSMKSLFNNWKQITKRGKFCKRTEKLLLQWEKKHYMFKYFALLNNNYRSYKSERALSDIKFSYDTLSSEMVHRYEADIQGLQRDLSDAYQLVKNEEIKRLQLEDDMKKMFMRNLAAMNREALGLFSQVGKNDVDIYLPSSQPIAPNSAGSKSDADYVGVAYSSVAKDHDPAMEEKLTINVNNSFILPLPTPQPEPGSILSTPIQAAVRSNLNEQWSESKVMSSQARHVPPTQDKGYFDKLSEQYRQSMATTNKLAQQQTNDFPQDSPSFVAGLPAARATGNSTAKVINLSASNKTSNQSSSQQQQGRSNTNASAQGLSRTSSGRWK